MEDGTVPPQPEVTGKAADVMAAAYYAAEVAARMIKPGNTNTEVSEAMKRVADTFEVERCQGVLMHQLKQFVIDGNKVTILRDEPDQKVRPHAGSLSAGDGVMYPWRCDSPPLVVWVISNTNH